jgi:hypothetical protein
VRAKRSQKIARLGPSPSGFAHHVKRHGSAFHFELGAFGDKNPFQN